MRRTLKHHSTIRSFLLIAGALALTTQTGCSTFRSVFHMNPKADEPKAAVAALPAEFDDGTVAAPRQGLNPYSIELAMGAPFLAENAMTETGELTTTNEQTMNDGDSPSPGAAQFRGGETPLYDGVENLTQVSFGVAGADFDPDISRDGKFVVFASTQHRRTPDLYIKRVGARSVTQLTADPASDVMPALSPDSSRIAFASDRTGSWDIFIMNSSGGQAVQITSEPSHELHPTWSPDGSKLAYCRFGSVSGRWELWVVDVTNPGLKHFIGYGLFPEWSPTSDTILYQRARERGERFFSIWTMEYVDGQGESPTEIVSSASAAVVNPSWAMDGRRIAYASISDAPALRGERPVKTDLWIVNLDGSGKANLTGGRFVNLMPTWGADNRVYFVSDRNGRDTIWAMQPDKAILAAAMTPITNLANVPTPDDD